MTARLIDVSHLTSTIPPTLSPSLGGVIVHLTPHTQLSFEQPGEIDLLIRRLTEAKVLFENHLREAHQGVGLRDYAAAVTV
jgi:hypothetical protein